MKDATLLFRQVSPSFVQLGRVTSQAFRPTTKDAGLLSAYDGDKVTAEKSWEHFTSQPDCEAVGTLGVTVVECSAEGLPARPDTETFPEHVVIDFTGVTGNQVEKKSKKLRAAAEVRGWQYQAPTSR